MRILDWEQFDVVGKCSLTLMLPSQPIVGRQFFQNEEKLFFLS